MDATLRNILRNTVTRCRKLLESSISEKLEGDFGIHADGTIEDAARLSHLSPEEQEYRERIVVHLNHIQAAGLKPKESVAQLIREAAFTHLNRLCAYKMMAARKLIDDPVGSIFKSRGFQFYLADHPEDYKLFQGGEQARSYRHYFEWLNAKLSEEIGVLFAPDDLASGLYPPHGKLEEVLEQINSDELKDVWREDETIGWVYQYFTSDEERRRLRKEHPSPINSYELAVRNQFFTPRYVVEFLTDNTLGRTWYEMRKGETRLVEACRYLVRRPNEVFLAEGEGVPEADGDRETSSATAWEQPAFIPHRAKKDPREIKVLDPASGSGHFLLYCFDLLTAIYEEAYEDAELGAELRREFPNEEEYKQAVPALILENNLHGIDIDLRVTQLAALALWMRAQRAYQEMNLKREARPAIKRISVVCAEPMPGEGELLDEFTGALPYKVLGDVVREVFEKMKLAGETGGLLRIEDDISDKLAEARKDWVETRRRQTKLQEERDAALFEWKEESPQAALAFDVSDITDEGFWQEAETRVVEALREYAARASNGRGLLRRLFADDAEQGFAFVDLCRKKFDVVLMNPPFGDASLPSKPYIDQTYGDTKGDVYKAFVECFQAFSWTTNITRTTSSRACAACSI